MNRVPILTRSLSEGQKETITISEQEKTVCHRERMNVCVGPNSYWTGLLPDGGEQGVLEHVGTIQEQKDTPDHDLQ